MELVSGSFSLMLSSAESIKNSSSNTNGIFAACMLVSVWKMADSNNLGSLPVFRKTRDFCAYLLADVIVLLYEYSKTANSAMYMPQIGAP